MFRMIGLAVLGVTLTLVGAYCYLWYEIKSQTDQAIQALAPFAKIQYGGTTVGLDGAMRWNDIKVQSRADNGELTVKEILIKLPDIQAIWDFKEKVAKNELPHTAKVAITGLSINLDNAFYDFIEKAERASENPYDFRVAGCGDVKRLGRDQLSAMGYGARTLDLSASYEFTPYSGVLNLNSAYVFQEDHGMEIDADIETGMSALSALQYMNLTPKFQRLVVRYNDLGLQDRLNAYCAYKAGIDETAYLQHHIDALVKHFDFYRISLGPNTVNAYTDYLKQGGELSITVDPDDTFDPFVLDTYDAAETIQWLRPTVIIGTQQLQDIDIAWEPGMLPKMHLMSFDEEETAETKTIEAPVEVREEPQFRATRLSELKDMFGREARIKTLDGKTETGRLVNYDGKRIEVQRQLQRGTYSIYVARKDVRSIEVYR